ncbi:unnamed protein product [Didymodactylos carnosus]|uniref:Serine palmitoyltransferase 1 n=1 Tax=Didymodactylos carnosus TaxID=1234261 RepID=A0A813TW26_9BILA|nr:unnamed protein product [Didymodactylos carnosus]CAF0834532.1 unnamed protein product [Didymodactylos carnosus]CAF3604403.1 unnamed protein product [Didymodactylos carnosus]CAF3619258.1 unnamed protein product [Didymodactylos carnosus]
MLLSSMSSVDIESLATDFYGLIQSFYHAPLYHIILEILLFFAVMWLLFFRKPRPIEKKLTEKEKQELIDEWQPEPLVPTVDPNHPALNVRILDGPVGKYITIDNEQSLNFASLNFLNFVGNERIQSKSIQAVQKYGVGSCGPRGFYGTIDIHLELEERLARFFGCEEGIIYSYGFSTIASIIPAYSKRNDVIFVDEGVHYAIQKGIEASRSNIKWFKHNDLDDLERLLIEQENLDKKNIKKARATRRFLIVEGLYMNYGDLCPLPRMVELKYKYKYRIFIDESVSFGTIGQTGRGITEYYNIDRQQIDLISSTLEYAAGSIGGFAVGSSFVVDHQRLSAQGYCFSASLPPLLAAAAIEALNIMEENSDLFETLMYKSEQLHNKLIAIKGYIIQGDYLSPLKHIRLPNEFNTTGRLESIVHFAQTKHITITVARYLQDEHVLPQPSIRLILNVDITEEEMDFLCAVLQEALVVTI